MKFIIPFNEVDHREQTQQFLDLVWHKRLYNNKQLLLSGVSFLVISIIFIYAKNPLAYLFTSLTTFCLITYGRYLQHYRKFKKSYYSQIEEYIQKEINTNSPIEWEFEEEFFRFKNCQIDLKCTWDIIKKTTEHNGTLFLFTNNEASSGLFLKEDSIEAAEYQFILLLIKRKVVIG